MKELNSLVLLMNKQNKYAFRESSERGQIVDRQQREGRRNRAHPCIRTHFVPFLSTFTLSGNLCPLEKNLQLTLGLGQLLFLFFTGKEENMSTLGILDIRRLNQVSVSL